MTDVVVQLRLLGMTEVVVQLSLLGMTAVMVQLRLLGMTIGRVQFIDHPPSADLYSRPMDVYPLEAHA
jgi:hypothetical protein